MKTLPEIIAKLTEKGEEFAHMTYVGPDYSKADLLTDLRELQAATLKPLRRAKRALEVMEAMDRLDG